MKFLISIVGPTGVGKTSLSLFLAKKYQAEIISCDSRQMYKYMDIGTAKIGKKVRDVIPHHFIDTLTPDQTYNANQFEKDAEAVIKELFKRHDVAITVGGSTLYIEALWNGFDEIPDVDPAIRVQLREEWEAKGLQPLLDELYKVDPTTFNEVDRKNPNRVMRAVEVYRGTGKPISFFRKGQKKKDRDYQVLKIGLRLERDALYNRINHRVEQMAKKGLGPEVQRLLDMGYGPELNAMQSIGYQEMIPFLKGETNFYSAVKLIQRNSRRYAKRQLNWYRRYPDIQWFEPGMEEEVAKWVEETVRA